MSEAMKQGKAALRALLQKKFPSAAWLMTGPATEVETDDIDEVYEFLLNAEIVEGPPGFREMVAELWPELLHKVKPPISEMH
jgi:hypothetical protein